MRERLFLSVFRITRGTTNHCYTTFMRCDFVMIYAELVWEWFWVQVRALELLFALGALDWDCRLTSPTGLLMAELPLDPPLAKVCPSLNVTLFCLKAQEPGLPPRWTPH